MGSSEVRILLVSASHGESPTQVRVARSVELSTALIGAGADVAEIALCERPILDDELVRVVSTPGLRDRELVFDPATCTRSGRWLAKFSLARCFGRTPAPGTPQGLRRAVDRSLAKRPADLVILRGTRLCDLIHTVDRRCPVVLDLGRWDPERNERLREFGREDAEAELRDDPSIEQLERFDAIFVSSKSVERRLRNDGLKAPILVCPPVATIAPTSAEPSRPPQILFSGSETIENLDGLRWFRHRVLPHVQKSVPSAELRVVGECARHTAAGTGLLRIGWVGDLQAELAVSSLVVLPLRIASGVRRRAIEALGAGRALALTPEIAADLELVPGRDAVVASDERELGRAIADVLSDDAERHRLEARSREIARTRFAPQVALAPLLSHLEVEREEDVAKETFATFV